MWTQEQKRAYHRKYYQDKIKGDPQYKAQNHKYYTENKSRIATYSQEYRQKHAEKIRDYQKEYHRKIRNQANDGGTETAL